MNTKGCVYVVESQGLYKIGKAANLSARLSELQGGNPLPLQLIHTFTTSQYDRLEKALHRIYASQRVRGEWFALSSADIEEIKSATVEYILTYATEIRLIVFQGKETQKSAGWPKYETWDTIQEPPQFVTPLRVIEDVYAGRGQKILIGSFTLMFSLAWGSEYNHTPLLNEDELIGYLRLSRRQYSQHVKDMKRLGWLHSQHPEPGMVQYFFEGAEQ